MFTHENILTLHSNPLGVMCQSFFRCEAARALIAAPNLVEGAAIFLLRRENASDQGCILIGAKRRTGRIL
jgi:hypothetical protein